VGYGLKEVAAEGPGNSAADAESREQKDKKLKLAKTIFDMTMKVCIHTFMRMYRSVLFAYVKL
jgi:hypothetical protein